MSVENDPEFRKALEEACERNYREYLFGAGNSGKIGVTDAEIRSERAKIESEVEGAKRHAERVREEARIMSDPAIREITENLRRMHSADGGLVCPKCGGTNHGNRMNGKPWCPKCNLPLMSREKAAGWVKPQKPKPKRFTFDPEEVCRVRK